MEDSNCLLTWFHFFGYTQTDVNYQLKDKTVSLRVDGAPTADLSAETSTKRQQQAKFLKPIILKFKVPKTVIYDFLILPK